jgi:hypothetical protein
MNLTRLLQEGNQGKWDVQQTHLFAFIITEAMIVRGSPTGWSTKCLPKWMVPKVWMVSMFWQPLGNFPNIKSTILLTDPRFFYDSRPDLIDPALLRPGRLDKALLCGMPSYDERLEVRKSNPDDVNDGISGIFLNYSCLILDSSSSLTQNDAGVGSRSEELCRKDRRILWR